MKQFVIVNTTADGPAYMDTGGYPTADVKYARKWDSREKAQRYIYDRSWEVWCEVVEYAPIPAGWDVMDTSAD